jgi:DNA topoisomerase-3
VRLLIEQGITRPKKGHDAGDHPPITPMSAADSSELSGDEWRVYEYITRHFIATLSPNAKFLKREAVFSIGDETFTCSGKKLLSPGFTAVMPWLAAKDEYLPELAVQQQCVISELRAVEGKTTPPDYLSESDLISLVTCLTTPLLLKSY